MRPAAFSQSRVTVPLMIPARPLAHSANGIAGGWFNPVATSELHKPHKVIVGFTHFTRGRNRGDGMCGF